MAYVEFLAPHGTGPLRFEVCLTVNGTPYRATTACGQHEPFKEAYSDAVRFLRGMHREKRLRQ